MVTIEEVSKVEEVSEVEVEVASSSSSSGDHHRWKYDVFLSFRGEDTRKSFVGHLYSALVRSGIYTFKDDERLKTGESISPALLKAIEESSFAIIVFSKNYASSRWCLDELVQVMECSSKSPKGQTAIPIFYDVEPSDVRKQEGHFGEMFRKHDSDKVQIWRKALIDATNLSGLELKKTVDGHESKFIDQIVRKIWSKLPSKIEVEDDGLVGMKSRIEEVTLLLGKEPNVVRTIGIWGLSGIGKSTLARVVYGQIKDQFEVAYFLDEVGEATKKVGLRSLQQHLLSETLGVKDLQIANDMDGFAQMKRRLWSTKVLLVLDDVDSLEQLEALAGSHEWFGPGSRIIITSRDKKLLVMHNVVRIHEMSVLGYVEAAKLFRWRAFHDTCPAEDFEELSVQVIKYSGRLPLALSVLGSALRGENIDFWKALLEKLRKLGPDGNILKKLKIGFDGLEKSVQNTFLDIACFFEGWQKERVTRILDSFDFYPDYSIRILIHKSLIHYSHGRVCMHQLIRDMGRHIGMYNRLWDTSDVERVLTRSKGTKNIEGILLHPQEREYTIEMGTQAFRKMTKLRFLEIHNACIPKGPDYLPDELRWIHWDKYPSNCLPTMFEADVLVGLRLRCSRLKQLWEGRTKKKKKKKKKLKNLKYVDLSYSKNLVRTSHLGEACNLEELILQGCTSLVKLDLSMGFLKKLVSLNLAWCENLVILPDTLCMLKSLKSLILSGCLKVNKLPEEIGNLECLEELLLNGTAVTELPPSIGCLKKLVHLNLAGCEMLGSLPEAIHWESLKVLNLSGCVKLQKFPDIRENMDKLLALHLVETAIEELPSSIGHIPNLVWIDLSWCKNLMILPSTICTLRHLKSLVLSGCSNVKKLPEEMGNLECLAELLLDGTAVTKLPPSIGCLKNLKNLSFGKSSSQSPASAFQSLFHPSKRQKTTSLVLSPIWGLTSLRRLNLSDCNLLAIPGDLGSLLSLEVLRLGGNKFENLPSLNQLSQLVCLGLNRCKMLQELPELPLRIRDLSAIECSSLRVSVDRLAKCKIKYGWFQNCRKLLDCGESEIVANTLLRQNLKGYQPRNFLGRPEHIIIPGGVIPKWFCNHTFSGHLDPLKLPQNWNFDQNGYLNPKIKGYSFFVIFGIDHHTDLRWSGLQGVELSFSVPDHDHLIHMQNIYIWGIINNTGLEHTIIGHEAFDPFMECSINWYVLVGIVIGIRSLTPDIDVKKWGVRLLFGDDDEDKDEDTIGPMIE